MRRVRLQIEKSAKINANLSTMVRFITKYMARVGRLRGFFIKRTIDTRFTVTIATAIDMVWNTASQVMH